MTDSRHLMAYALLTLMVIIGGYAVLRFRRAAGRSRRPSRIDIGGHR